MNRVLSRQACLVFWPGRHGGVPASRPPGRQVDEPQAGMPVYPGNRLGQLVRVGQDPSPLTGPPIDVGEGDVADNRRGDQLSAGRPQLAGGGHVHVLAGVDPQHPAPERFPGSFLDGLEPTDDTPCPRIHDADHAGRFSGHRALAAAAARSGQNWPADIPPPSQAWRKPYTPSNTCQLV